MEMLKPHSNFFTFIFIALCAVIAIAPLPLGTARPLAWDIMSLVVGLILVSSFFLRLNGDPFTKDLAPSIILFGIVVVFVLLQASPRGLSAWQNPVWDQAADALDRRLNGSISTDPTTALVYLLRLICYAAIFYLAWLTGRDGSRARAAVELVTVSGCVYAIYGLIVYWSGNKTILLFSKWAYTRDLTGTFVNRNSFATYLGLCTLTSICLLLQSFTQIELHGDWRKKLTATIEFISTRIGKLIMLFVLVTALFLTHSRGGLLATLSGVIVLMFIIVMAPSLARLRRIGAWSAVPITVLLIALFISGGGTFNRIIFTDFDTEQRLAIYRLVLQAISNYPVLGIGLGSFVDIFPIYRTSAITSYYDMAHNDYLQNILELGIPTSLCLFATIGWLIVKCLRGVRIRQRDALYPCLAVAASVLVGLHATIDFSLQIPAVTVTYLFLLGIGVAQSFSSRASIIKTSSGAAQRFSGKPDNAPDQISEQA